MHLYSVTYYDIHNQFLIDYFFASSKRFITLHAHELISDLESVHFISCYDYYMLSHPVLMGCLDPIYSRAFTNFVKFYFKR